MEGEGGVEKTESRKGGGGIWEMKREGKRVEECGDWEEGGEEKRGRNEG